MEEGGGELINNQSPMVEPGWLVGRALTAIRFSETGHEEQAGY